MTVFICVDDRMGMAFNKRRQSRDSAINEKIVEMSVGKRLLMNDYSSKMFGAQDVFVSERYLEDADENDCCFVEREDISSYVEKIDTIVLFKWNKVYPSDVKLEINMGRFRLNNSFDFEGSSHSLITCEVWKK